MSQTASTYWPASTARKLARVSPPVCERAGHELEQAPPEQGGQRRPEHGEHDEGGREEQPHFLTILAVNHSRQSGRFLPRASSFMM